MRTLLLSLSLALSLTPFGSQSSDSKSKFPLGERLRNEFTVAMNSYIDNLHKLRTSYERDVRRWEERFAQSRSYYEQGLIALSQVDEEQRLLEEARNKVLDVDERVAFAKKQISELPSAAELEREHRKKMRASRQSATCPNWTLTASRRETRRGVTLSWKLVCSR